MIGTIIVMSWYFLTIYAYSADSQSIISVRHGGEHSDMPHESPHWEESSDGLASSVKPDGKQKLCCCGLGNRLPLHHHSPRIYCYSYSWWIGKKTPITLENFSIKIDYKLVPTSRHVLHSSLLRPELLLPTVRYCIV